MKGVSYLDLAKVLAGLTVSDAVSTGTYASPISRPTYHALCLIDDLCFMMEEGNPNFSRKLFIKACGFEPWDELIMGMPTGGVYDD